MDELRIEQLPALLAHCAPPVRQLNIVLSNHYARFQIVQPEAGVNSAAEFHAWSALCFERDAGLERGSFEQRLASTDSKRPTIACAVDKPLLSEIVRACGAVRIGLIEPLWVTVFNHWRSSLEEGVLVVVEPGRIVLGVFAGGQCAALASRFVVAGDRSALADMLEDYLGNDVPSRQLSLFDPAGEVDPPSSARWTVRHLGAEALPTAAVALGLSA